MRIICPCSGGRDTLTGLGKLNLRNTVGRDHMVIRPLLRRNLRVATIGSEQAPAQSSEKNINYGRQ